MFYFVVLTSLKLLFTDPDSSHLNQFKIWITHHITQNEYKFQDKSNEWKAVQAFTTAKKANFHLYI